MANGGLPGSLSGLRRPLRAGGVRRAPWPCAAPQPAGPVGHPRA